MTTPRTVDVVVPSYRRPELLARCLDALRAQRLAPSSIVVGVRAGDDATVRVATSAAVAVVDLPGVVAAMKAATARTTAPIVAFIDDDAVAPPDWLDRIVAHLADPTVGAIGGRDRIVGQEGPRQPVVGVIRPWGRVVGNHHLGIGPPRDVDVLKGVNMAFRAEALAFPAEGVLRGAGAQVHFEMLLCRWARRAGWRLRYDPDLVVDHGLGQRVTGEPRVAPDADAVRDAAHNRMRALRPAHLGWVIGVGQRDVPGLGRAAVAAIRGDRDVVRRLGPALSGSVAGFVTKPPRMITCAELRSGVWR